MASVFSGLPDRPDLCDRIVSAFRCERPVLLFGTGDGADKTVAWLSSLGGSPAGVFVSPEFARGQSFRGFAVTTPDEALDRWENPFVLLCFASREPAVIGRIEALARRCDLAVPDFPVAGGALFDRAFALSHRDEIERAYRLFSDERSREVYSSLLSYKLSGELAPLLASADGDYDPLPLLSPARWRRVLDGGAYDGDTARAILDSAPGVREILCVEPDERNYRRLLSYRDRETRAAITPVHAALSDAPGTATLFAAGNRNSTLFRESHEARREEVGVATVDELLAGDGIDLLKLDVEGAEGAALRGAKETLARFRPALLVSAYHRSEDLFALPLLLNELCPGCRLYLRRRLCVPAWEVDLLALPDQSV